MRRKHIDLSRPLTQEIISLLRKHGEEGLSRATIAFALNRSNNYIRETLRAMSGVGMVEWHGDSPQTVRWRLMDETQWDDEDAADIVVRRVIAAGSVPPPKTAAVRSVFELAGHI